jgi:hypothetical protein
VKFALVEASSLGNLTSLFLKAGKSHFGTYETAALKRIEIRVCEMRYLFFRTIKILASCKLYTE